MAYFFILLIRKLVVGKVEKRQNNIESNIQNIWNLIILLFNQSTAMLIHSKTHCYLHGYTTTKTLRNILCNPMRPFNSLVRHIDFVEISIHKNLKRISTKLHLTGWNTTRNLHKIINMLSIMSKTSSTLSWQQGQELHPGCQRQLHPGCLITDSAFISNDDNPSCSHVCVYMVTTNVLRNTQQ